MTEANNTPAQDVQFDLAVHTDAIFGEHRAAGWG